MRHSGRHTHFSPRHRRTFLRWMLLTGCILVLLGLCYGCAVQQLVYSARGTVIFLPELAGR